jgi:hypothetical protein
VTMLRRPEERQETVEPPSTARRLLLVRILEAVGSKHKWSVRKLSVCWLTFPDLGSRPRDRHTAMWGIGSLWRVRSIGRHVPCHTVPGSDSSTSPQRYSPIHRSDGRRVDCVWSPISKPFRLLNLAVVSLLHISCGSPRGSSGERGRSRAGAAPSSGPIVRTG